MRERLKTQGVDDIELRPGRSGQFDIIVDGELRYTRSKTSRFPTDAEIEAVLSS